MAYKTSTLDRTTADKTVYMADVKNPVGYRDSLIFLSQDSGYNESLKAFSPGENSSDSLESKTPRQEFENSENVDPTLVCSPIRSKIFWESETGSNAKHMVTEIYETPRVIKKDSSLRRRLLLSKATSGGNLDFDASECSAETYGRKKTLQRVQSFECNLSNSFVDSPRDLSYKPIATSTLKTELDSGMSCVKWRLSFAQQRSSTLDESKCDTVPFPEVENLSPVQYSADSTDDSILSVNEENISEVPSTPTCNIITCGKEEFRTPVSDLAASFRFHLCTPTGHPANDFDSSITEDSAFHSLSLDKSQDSLTDHEGSFQELIQKQKETPKSTHKNRLRKLERCRRLSTLRERGSQSEVEEECSEKQLLTLTYKSKVARNSVDEENELSCEDSGTNSLLKIDDLTGTPALRVVHEILVRSTRKRAQQATMQELLGSLDYSELSEDGLTRLIGRKMGLEKIDILSELKYRNLKHILALIFKVLNVESICSIWKVSKEWREMVLQDKNAYQRRKSFLKRQKVEAERGRVSSSEDATTRLHLLNRSALKSVQAQARFVFHTPTSSCGSLTPKDSVTTHPSASKQQEYVKIAKTLFTDEALKPCPQCQYPAKYQPLKKRGKCSRKDCGFDFCVLCLCTFHGSKECGGGSVKRVHKKDTLPGSAQSKRNLKRL